MHCNPGGQCQCFYCQGATPANDSPLPWDAKRKSVPSCTGFRGSGRYHLQQYCTPSLCPNEIVPILFERSCKKLAEFFKTSIHFKLGQHANQVLQKKKIPLHKTRMLKKSISSFTEKPGETLGSSWERYKDLLRAVPHHGFDDAQLVAYFYEGIS